jgi:hypothetical protein
MYMRQKVESTASKAIALILSSQSITDPTLKYDILIIFVAQEILSVLDTVNLLLHSFWINLFLFLFPYQLGCRCVSLLLARNLL